MGMEDLHKLVIDFDMNVYNVAILNLTVSCLCRFNIC